MRKAISVVLTLAVVAGHAAQAKDGEGFFPGEQVCFRRHYDDHHLAQHPRQTVREIEIFRSRVQVDGDKDAEDSSKISKKHILETNGIPALDANWIGMSVKFVDADDRQYLGAAVCSRAPSGRFVCVDGACGNYWGLTMELRGRDTLVVRPGTKDDMSLDLQTFRVAACGGGRGIADERDIPNLETPYSAEAPSDDREFRLVRAPASRCSVPARWKKPKVDAW